MRSLKVIQVIWYLLTVRYENTWLVIRSSLFLDKSRSTRLSCPLKLSSAICVILFFCKSANDKIQYIRPLPTSNKHKLTSKYSTLPNILSFGNPQNECRPMAGTLESTIRSTCSSMRCENMGPIAKLFFGPNISITFMYLSNCPVGIDFMPPENGRERKRWRWKFGKHKEWILEFWAAGRNDVGVQYEETHNLNVKIIKIDTSFLNHSFNVSAASPL